MLDLETLDAGSLTAESVAWELQEALLEGFSFRLNRDAWWWLIQWVADRWEKISAFWRNPDGSHSKAALDLFSLIRDERGRLVILVDSVGGVVTPEVLQELATQLEEISP